MVDMVVHIQYTVYRGHCLCWLRREQWLFMVDMVVLIVYSIVGYCTLSVLVVKGAVVVYG